jgi:murein DD-endopeptidase MepM/ murein hydrolase activator NlpD
MLPVRIWLAVVLSLVCLPLAKARAAIQPGTYTWPVRGPVIRPYEAPSSPYGSGHRGIDIAAPFGTTMVAAQGGVVAFAGWVAGALYISIDHPDGVRTTYSWVSAVSVKKGDTVARGQVIGNTGHGDPDESMPCLHFGARIGRTYIDPMTLLEPGDVVGLIHLGPLDQGSPSSASSSGNHAA